MGDGEGVFAIGCPGSPQAKLLESVMGMEKPAGTVWLNGGMGTPGRQKMSIAEARNGLIEDFLVLHEKVGRKKPFQFLLMVDGDAVLHRGTLVRLQSWNKMIVGALCVTRYRPYQPVVYRGVCTETAADMRSYYIQWEEVREWVLKYPALMKLGGPALLAPCPEDALHKVDWTGSHCMLIHRSVFETVEPPWFEMASRVKHGSGSDRLFGEKCKAAGIPTWVDYSVVAGHEANMVLGMADFMAWQSISMEEKPEAALSGEGEDGEL